MSEDQQKKESQPTQNFGSIAAEHDVVFDVQSSVPKFDTTLPTRSPSVLSNSNNHFLNNQNNNIQAQSSSFHGNGSNNGDGYGLGSDNGNIGSYNNNGNNGDDGETMQTFISLPKSPHSNSKKRSSHSVDDTAEDILEQICSQMNTLSTQDSNDDKIAAFMSVLACAHAEAEFFLESALWSVEAAVSLWLESGVGQVAASSMTFMDNNKKLRRVNDDADRGSPYYNRQLIIEGLPPSWTAWVSSSSGQVYFQHTSSGHTQFNVPPRFADSNQGLKNENNNNEYDGYRDKKYTGYADGNVYMGMRDQDNEEDEDKKYDDDIAYIRRGKQGRGRGGGRREDDEDEDNRAMGVSSSSMSSRDRTRDRDTASADSCDVESGGDVGDGSSLDGMAGTISGDRDREGLGEGDDDVSVSSSAGQNNSNNSVSQATEGATSATNLDSYNDLDSSNSSESNRMF